MSADEPMTARLSRLFDELGDSEWHRLDKDARSRVSLEIHRRFLRRHVAGGASVLEIGAGAGRFTVELAQMACRIVVTDISPVQLTLNERHVSEAGLAAAVTGRRILDVCDLSSVADASFDAVVAVGGPLSYAFEGAEASLAEMLRIVRPGGVVVASVMGMIGTMRFFLSAIPKYAGQGRLDVLKQVVATGDNRFDVSAHPCRMFRWREIDEMVGRLPCTLVGASASNFLSVGEQPVVDTIEEDPALWALLLDWEEECCAEPGALDSGTHMLFAVERI